MFFAIGFPSLCSGGAFCPDVPLWARFTINPSARADQLDNVELAVESEAAMGLLAPGGRLLYSVCTLGSDESGDVLPMRDGFDGAYAARLVRIAASKVLIFWFLKS